MKFKHGDIVEKVNETKKNKQYVIVDVLEETGEYQLKPRSYAGIAAEGKVEKVSEDKIKKIEASYKIPVTWEMSGFATISASSLAEAIKKFDEIEEDLPLPSYSDYVDGSFHRDHDNPEAIAYYQY